MKILILLPLLLSSLAFASTLEVEKMTAEENFELRFRLVSSQKSDGHAILDCQSFFQKLDFFDSKGEVTSENYININECEYLHQQTVQCLLKEKKKCFDSDFIFYDACECEE